MVIFGTRPEVIKMAPVIDLLEKSPAFEAVTVATGQHRELQAQALRQFNMVPKYDLDIMVAEASLTKLTANALHGLEEIITHEKPDMILVQGDTTTTFVGSLAAFYNGIAIGHIEAGLRSHEKFRPFPEEINRKLVTQLADLHFVPTFHESQILNDEGVAKKSIFVTGNTAIDALRHMINPDFRFHSPALKGLHPYRRLLIVTSHRRENFGEPLLEICGAIEELIRRFPDIEVVFSVHPNPNCSVPVRNRLSSTERVHLVEPLDYADMANLVAKSCLVLTDSGGLQEEAPALGIPVIVLREVTERPEVVDAGLAILVGTSRKAIVDITSELLTDQDIYMAMSRRISPYGDGYASRRIFGAMEYFFRLRFDQPDPFRAGSTVLNKKNLEPGSGCLPPA